MEIEDTEFYAENLIKALEEAGFKAYVEQTGGGTATLYANKVEGDNKILGGPGSYNWREPGKSVFTSDEFFVGEDAYDNDDQPKDHDPESVASESGDDVPALVALFVSEYEKHNQPQ